MSKSTTIKKLINNQCYCGKKDKDIALADCILFDCNRWKKCMKKTNNDIDKDLKKENRREINGKTS